MRIPVLLLIFSVAWAHAETVPKCDSLLGDIDYSLVIRAYLEAPSTELKIQILQRFPGVVPDSANQIRVFALKSIFLELEAKRDDFIDITVIPLRALGEVGIFKDIMLLDQVIRSGKDKAAYVAMISKEKILARVENRTADIVSAVTNTTLIQNILTAHRDMPFSAREVNLRLRNLEPFVTADERQIITRQMLQVARTEIQFIVYGLENNSYNFINLEKKFPAYYHFEYLSRFGDESDVKLLDKFMMLVAPNTGPGNEELAFRQYHFAAASKAATDLRTRLKMRYAIYDHTSQGD